MRITAVELMMMESVSKTSTTRFSSSAMQEDGFEDDDGEDDYEEEAGYKLVFPSFINQDEAPAKGPAVNYGSRKDVPFTRQVRTWRYEFGKFREKLYSYVAPNGASSGNKRQITILAFTSVFPG
jgi:hypothetical protein